MSPEFYDSPLYCGYWFDAESALYQVRNRYYDSGLSTFISRDPAAADINLYRYCSNNPLIYTDPRGLKCDLSSFTCDQLKTALGKARGGLDVATEVTATGRPPWECGGSQAGNPTTGAKDPVQNAYEKCYGYALFDLSAWFGGMAYWMLSKPYYWLFYSENDQFRFWQAWGIMEANRHFRLINLIEAELESRCQPPHPPCK